MGRRSVDGASQGPRLAGHMVLQSVYITSASASASISILMIQLAFRWHGMHEKLAPPWGVFAMGWRDEAMRGDLPGSVAGRPRRWPGRR